tara:strand:- start:1801 stop:2241 length:441 start_codon:yes stop_codon:yes gene_type:complete
MSNIERIINEKKQEAFMAKFSTGSGKNKKPPTELQKALYSNLQEDKDFGLSKKFKNPLGGGQYRSKVKPTGAASFTPPRMFASATTEAYQALLNSNNPSIIKWIDSRGASLTINPKTSGGFASSKFSTPAPSVAEPDKFGKEIKYV